MQSFNFLVSKLNSSLTSKYLQTPTTVLKLGSWNFAFSFYSSWVVSFNLWGLRGQFKNVCFVPSALRASITPLWIIKLRSSVTLLNRHANEVVYLLKTCQSDYFQAPIDVVQCVFGISTVSPIYLSKRSVVSLEILGRTQWYGYHHWWIPFMDVER